jgi:hypothetical protein
MQFVWGIDGGGRRGGALANGTGNEVGDDGDGDVDIANGLAGVATF